MIRELAWLLPGSEHVSRHAPPLRAPVSRRVAITAARYREPDMAKAKSRKSPANNQKRATASKAPASRGEFGRSPQQIKQLLRRHDQDSLSNPQLLN